MPAMNILSRLFLLIFVLTLPVYFSPSLVEGASTKISELSESDLNEIGRKIYQNGIMADGTPLKAIVMGDVEVTGDQFTCTNCHRRSGLGGPEGTKYVLPTNGKSLLAPRIGLYLERPEYSYETFVDAMTMGANPNGLAFDPIMPIYDLPDLEMGALFSYLKTLSNEYSPGVTDEVLHIATVVGKDVEPQLKKEMLDIINAYFEDKNGLTRYETKRSKSGPFYHEYRNKAYRRWVLHVWELSGPAETWPEQLKNYYQQQPVFAMFSGMVSGPWAPIHNFCRDNKIPCLLPNTDLPSIDDPADFYTFYYSKGLTLEAQTLRTVLTDEKTEEPIIQVYRQGTKAEHGARTFSNISKPLKEKSINLPTEGKIDWQNVEQQIAGSGASNVMLWLDADDLKAYSEVFGDARTNISVYLSSTLLNGDISDIPKQIKLATRVVHPFNLKKDQDARFRAVLPWLNLNKIPLTNPRIQGQTYYACLLLNGGLKHIKRYHYREYFLDLLDHGDSMALYSANYPRLSFGPEQRFLAKGAYLIDLDSGESRWVISNY